MSVVYLAEQTRLGRKVALKVLASGLGDSDEFRTRFLQESHAAASLEHPNIIPIYDAGEASGCLYIAMRYVDGRDLGEVLKAEGALSLGRTLFILEQVAGALDAAHESGLVHRDVKPANVLLVGNTDRVYLTDFGVAKPTTSAGLTRTGSFIGTPDYCAPEQIEGREVDVQSDVYALGGVLYSCLTGGSPYERDTEVAVLQAHLLEPPPKLSEVRPDLPRGLDRVIATAMAKSKEERYSTCGALATAAEAAAHDLPTMVPLSTAGATILSPPEQGPPHAADPSGTVLTPESVTPAQITVPAAAQTAPPGDGVGNVPAAGTAMHSQPPDRRHGTSKPRWMLAGAALTVLVLAGIGGGLAFKLGGSSAKKANAGTNQTNLTALQQAVQRANKTVMAKGMFPVGRCADAQIGAGVERLTCPNVWSDVSAVLYRYPSLTALYARYHRDLSQFRLIDGTTVPPNAGNCIGSGATGEAAWRHPPYPVQTTKLTPSMPASMAQAGWEGRVFCGESSTQPFLFEWTYDPGRLLGIASSLDHTDVWTWWHALHHNVLFGSMAMSMSGSNSSASPPAPASTAAMGGSAMGNQSATGKTFHVTLSGGSEVSKGMPMSGTGSSTATVSIDGTKVCWSFRLSGVDKPTAAHIHRGGASVSGPIVVPLGGAYKAAGCTTTTETNARSILASPPSYYVNVHNAMFPDGAVRGQL